MMIGIVLGAAALALSAASASADGYSHVYRHHYGASKVFVSIAATAGLITG
jgi:hypothetical protein